MINQSLRCPSCGQFGFIVDTEGVDLDAFVATICHYCGHVLDRNALIGCLARGDAAPSQPSTAPSYRRARRKPGRR